MNTEETWNFLLTHATDLGLKIISALLIWFVGRWAIKLVAKIFSRILEKGQRVDRTLVLYIREIISWLLTLLLILSIFGIFGIQTTSFAALLAGLGLAVGTAWGGLLAHFAAGVFIQLMRPFKVGDTITAAGINGVVTDIGVFTTTIIAAGNVQTIVGNNKIFSDTIQNFSALPYRRIDCSITIPYSIDPQEAMNRFKEAICAIPNVRTNPVPSISIAEFTVDGTRLSICPFAAPENYSQVQSDSTKAIAQVIRSIGTPRSELHIVDHTGGSGPASPSS